jgi:hypothetical protein
MCLCVFIVLISYTCLSDSLAVTIPKLITATPVGMDLWISRCVHGTSVRCVHITFCRTVSNTDSVTSSTLLYLRHVSRKQEARSRNGSDVNDNLKDRCLILKYWTFEGDNDIRKQTENRQCSSRFVSKSERLVT